MFQRDLNYIFLQIIKGLVFLLLFTPLVVMEGFNFISPYDLPKTIFLRIIIELILIFYIFLAISDKNYRPKFTPLTIAVLIFFLIAIVASLAGQDVWRSFFSTLERSEGLITLLHLLILFLIIPSVFKSFTDFISLFNSLILVNLLVGFYALVQKFNLPFILAGAGHRVFSTIGNAAPLSSFLLIGVFICLAFFVYKKDWRWRSFYIFTALLNIFIIFNTQTRSAVLALLISLIILFLSIIFLTRQKNLKYIVLLILLIFIGFSILIYLNRQNPLIKNNQTLLRLTTTTLTEVALQDRLLTWQAGLRGFWEQPFLGWGWENFNYAFNQHFPPQIYRDSGSVLYFDRAHNFIVELLVTTGILGLGAYLAIIIFAFGALLKKNEYSNYSLSSVEGRIKEGCCKFSSPPLTPLHLRRGNEKRNFNRLIALGLLAYLLNNLFSFDWLINWLLFFLILAYVCHCEESRRNVGTTRQSQTFLLKLRDCFGLRPRNDKVATEEKVSPFVLTLVPFLILIFCFWLNIKTSQAVYQLSMIIRQPVEPESALARFEGMPTCFSCDQEKFYWLAVYSKQVANSDFIKEEKKMALYQRIDKELTRILGRHPQNVAYLLNLLSFYNDIALLDPNYHEKIKKWGQTALKFSPTRPQIYYELAKAEISLKNYDQALDYLKKAAFLAPKNYEPHQKLAETYLLADRLDEAQREKEVIERLGGKIFN